MIRQADLGRPVETFEFRSGRTAPIRGITRRAIALVEALERGDGRPDDVWRLAELLMPDAHADDIAGLEPEEVAAIAQIASGQKDAVFKMIEDMGNASGVAATAQASTPGTPSTTSSRGSRGGTAAARSRTRSSTKTSRPSPGTT